MWGMKCGRWKCRMFINKTRNRIISQHEKVCKSIFSQSLGLMFRKKQNLLMIFPQERNISLHMVFVFYPIDVLIVGEDMRIKEIKRNFKPFTFWSSKEKGKYVVELGLKTMVKVGDSLQHCLLPEN